MKQTLEAQNLENKVEFNQINEKLKSLQEDLSHQNSKLNNKIQKIVEEEWTVKFENIEKELSKQVDLKLKEHSNSFEKSLGELHTNLKSLQVSSQNETLSNQKKISEVEDSSRKTHNEINEKIKSIRQVIF